jgi:beta-lactamase superfamily II metal-dependent hydrolase
MGFVFLLFNRRDENYFSSMEIHFFGVGRADAILIKTANHSVMIDTGENRHGDYLVNHLNYLDIYFLDYLIITHFDSDHVGGAHTIIDSIEIGKIIVPNYSRESRHVERFINSANNAGLLPYVLTQQLQINLDNAQFILDPSGLEYIHFARVGDDDYFEIYDDDAGDFFAPTGDDFSIIVSVTHGENNLLFTADATNHRLAEFFANEALINNNYNLIKIPRHGRYVSNAVNLINMFQPAYAVITGFHPDLLHLYHPERPADVRIIQALENAGAQIFFTMSSGVSFYSDGAALRQTSLINSLAGE